MREASLSGIANRYVDLRLGPGNEPKIPSGGVIPTTGTTSAVDLDQLFNTLNPPTLEGLQNLIQGTAAQYAGKGAQVQAAWQYLNPAVAASSALFSGGIGHYLRQFSPIGPETLSFAPNRDANNRGDTYPPPLWLANPQNAGKNNFPAWDCKNTGAPGDGSVSSNGLPAGAPGAQAACWVARAQPGAPGPSQNPHILAKSYPAK